MVTELVVPATEREVEVLAKAERRRFTLEYKRQILQQTDACTKPGELGALLRREGLYSSHFAAWRAARTRRELSGSQSPRRGPKPRVVPADSKRIKCSRKSGSSESTGPNPG